MLDRAARRPGRVAPIRSIEFERARRRAEVPEIELAKRGLTAAGIAALPVVVLATLMRGIPGLRGAVLATVLVVGLFAVSGLVLACAARRSPGSLPTLSLVGAVVRMVAYGVLLATVSGVDGVDRATTALATGVLLIVALACEVRLMTSKPGFYWLRVTAPHGGQPEERTRR